MVNEKKAALALAVARHMPRQKLIGEWSRLAAEPISSELFSAAASALSALRPLNHCSVLIRRTSRQKRNHGSDGGVIHIT